MPDENRSSQEQLDQILAVISTQSTPYVELTDEAIAHIIGGLYLQATQPNQSLHEDDNVPDCLIWDIDTPN
ncbi:MAG: hypothetical protein AAGF83_11320 [Cyanobacteria bacterium P01_G01_bin.67]